MILDATNQILGRLASFAAKHALLGESISIINCENAVVSGNKTTTLEIYNHSLERGSRAKGPFTYRRPDTIVKRTIKGMLPSSKDSGKKALKRIRCYIGIPENFKGKQAEKLTGMDISKLSIMKYTTVKDICIKLGGKL
ncbi:MAG: 50S ribosomal protein L13 [Nanoarchaeota archaeon]|nr:50S ribosomal protein L13 [Nanoarchaeota archaeon]MBU1004406.1 50S ribosomal protein L13 [Nanoarchaeota archaeon]MBU1946707.1 50S ribosomal protein L13 [Nanoarchaeota archaeon]